MNSPKPSISSNNDVHMISLFRSNQYSSIISLSPSKNYEKRSIITFAKKDSLSSQGLEDLGDFREIRASSFKKGFRNTKGSIMMFQNKRKSSILMNPRKPSFLSEMDEEKNRKKIMNIFDVYTEEQMINTAIKILQKPRNYRTNTDIKMLIKCTEKVNFFAEMINNQESDKHEECCRVMGYIFAKQGETIVQEGSIGQTFYIILKGSVGIYKNEPYESTSSSNLKETEGTKKLLTKKSTILLRPSIAQIRRLSTRNKENLTTEDTTDNMNKIKVLKDGEAFGELSLMDNKPRAATVICEQDCHLAILEKQFFDKVLKELEKKKLFKQIEFFSSLKLFSSWSYNAVKNLYYLTSQLEFKKFMTVYKEKDPPGDVYIIKSGEFKVLKSLDNHKKNPSINIIDSLLITRSSNRFVKGLEVCLLGPGEAFGEEELVDKIPRLHTIVCNSLTGIVFVIDQKEFLKRVYLSQTAKRQLKEQIHSKAEWREKRLEDNLLEKNNNKIKNLNNLIENSGISQESNIDPEEFAMIKGMTSRAKNVISNMKEIYYNPLDHIQQKDRKKDKMIPVMENIVDPIALIGSLKDKTFLKELTSNSPKKNIFILNNLIRQERKNSLIKKNQQKYSKSFEKSMEKELIEKKFIDNAESLDTVQENLIKSEENLNKFNQIILPMSTSSINNYLKVIPQCEDEYQLKYYFKRKKSKKDFNIKSIEKKNHNTSHNMETLKIEGKGSNTPRIEVWTQRRCSNLSQDSFRFLPLKYSSDKIKRNAHTPSLSLSAMTRKTSRNENYLDEESLTPKH